MKRGFHAEKRKYRVRREFRCQFRCQFRCWRFRQIVPKAMMAWMFSSLMGGLRAARNASSLLPGKFEGER